MCKLVKWVRNCVVFWKNLHSWQKFYRTAGRDGRDKFQVCYEDLPTTSPHNLSLPLNSCSISTTSSTSGASSLCSILTNFDYGNLHKQLSTAKGSLTMDSDAPLRSTLPLSPIGRSSITLISWGWKYLQQGGVQKYWYHDDNNYNREEFKGHTSYSLHHLYRFVTPCRIFVVFLPFQMFLTRLSI